jgi:phage shock protein E
MKKIFMVLVVMAACSSPETKSELQADPFKNMIDSGATIIDVRTPEEYASGHIPGSRNINIKDPDFDRTILTLDKAKSYAVYCASGVRSGKAAGVMRDHGFMNVYTLEGGIRTWKEKGLPVE